MHSAVEIALNVMEFVLDVVGSWFGNQSQQVQPRTKKKVTKKG